MSKKHKILFTISEFMYSSQVRNLCDLVAGIDKDIFDVEIGALDLGDEATQEIVALDVPFYLLRTHPPHAREELNLKYLKDFLTSPSILRQKKPNLVSSLLYQSIFTEALFVKMFTRAKYVFTKSNHQWANHRWSWRMKSRLTDKIISISRSTDELLASEGFKDKIYRIFLGINVSFFKEDKEQGLAFSARHNLPKNVFAFGCAAQFIECKRHHVLIEAFEKLTSRYDNVALYLCGPNAGDEYYRSVTAMLEKSPAKDKIYLLGVLKDMPAFYSAVDCFVLPSENEPFGYVYIEAMSCNKPAIACREAGPLDIIEDGQSGFHVNTNDPADLADKMSRYLENRDLLMKHGRAARQRVEKLFSTQAMVGNHQKLYLDMLEGKL